MDNCGYISSMDNFVKIFYLWIILSFQGHGGPGWDPGYPFSDPSVARFNFSFDHSISDPGEEESTTEADYDTNPDILPFSEDEYEKIPVDQDTQTDDVDLGADDRKVGADDRKEGADETKENLSALADGDKMWRSLSQGGELSEVCEKLLNL